MISHPNDRPVTYQAITSHESWPKCHRCSRQLGAPFPVEYFGILGREPGRTAESAYRLVIEVRCSGESLIEDLGLDPFSDRVKRFLGFRKEHGACTQRIVMESPRRWTEVAEQQALARIFAFAPGGKPGEHGIIFAPGSNRSRHRLETEVRSS